MISVLFYVRIRGLVKVKTLHDQVASMEKIVGQMKVNKEQVSKQVQQLKQKVDQLIKEITVGFVREFIEIIYIRSQLDLCNESRT